MRASTAGIMATLLVVLGIVVATIVGVLRDRGNDALIEGRLQVAIGRASTELTSRLQRYDLALRGVRGAVIGAGGETISRERFAAYAKSRNAEREFPGAVGFGFVRRVPVAQEEAYVASVRASGLPSFAIRTLTSHAHEHEHLVIELLEPFEPNRQAIGLDVASEPNRRSAALQALRTGEVVITAPIELVQLPDRERTGFLMFLPVYRGLSPPSAAERDAQTVGWSYAAVGLARVLATFDQSAGEETIALSDVTDGAPVPMYSSPGHRADGLLRKQRVLTVYGRKWRLELAAGPALLPRLRLGNPVDAAAEVMTISLLFALAAYLYLSTIAQARRAAEQQHRELEERVEARTEELRQVNDRQHVLAVQLQTAQRITKVGSWELDVRTGHPRWSEELYRVFGLDPADEPPPYAAQAAYFAEESWTRLNVAIQKTVATGEPFELELMVVRSDGERRNVIARGEALVTPSGLIEHVVGTLQDVTTRERTAAQLRVISERLKLATSAADIGIWEIDLHTKEVFWDETMERMYGRPAPNGPTSERLSEFVHPEDLADVAMRMRHAARGSSPTRLVFRTVRPDQETRYVHCEGYTLRDENGKPARIVGISRDVTDRHLIETALRKSEAMQRAMLAHAGSAMIGTDTVGTITLFNRAAEELLGYTAGEVVERATPALFHDPSEIEQHRQELEQARGAPVGHAFEEFVAGTHEGKAEVREWTLVRKDGGRVPVVLTIAALRDDRSTLVGYLAIATDLTEQKSHQRALVELNELLSQRSLQAESASHAKSMFLANMSHEIRTPIGAITGLTYLLSRTSLTGEQRKLLHTIERSTRTLLSMVNDVLDLSKIEAGQLVLEEEPFSLGEVLSDVSGFMNAYATGKRLELILDAPDVAPSEMLVGDRVRLMQVLTNLAGNAIKYTDEGSVRLLVRHEEAAGNAAHLSFEVQDTGPGMDPAFLPRLFSTFTQAEQRGGKKREGTGLGLAIVKQLVTLMGGTVGVESALGAGSRFWCRIPFERAAPDTRSRRDGSELRVLVVDDHDAQRVALASCTKQLGWSVQVATDGATALATALDRARANLPFDVILLDWKMPGMDGLEVLAQLRSALAEGGFRQPCVLVTTAHDLTELHAETEDGLADALLAKPVTASTLFDAVVQAMAARGTAKDIPSLVPPSGAGQRLPGVTLLVADDSDINREMAQCILELEGAVVHVACDGREAVKMVCEGATRYDLVLMDVQMPEQDGVEATRQIRADPRFANLPILALTAGALATERYRAISAGMDDFLTKPFEPEKLIARVREYISAARGTPLGITTLGRATQAPKGGWPSVEGIDVDAAQARLGGDVALFRSLLGRLLAELDRVSDSNLLSRGHVRDAELIGVLHKVRGMAGNLGASVLEDLARGLEHALRTSGHVRVEEWRVRLVAELDRVRASVRTLLNEAPEDTAPPANDNAPLDRAALERLRAQLREQDLDALALAAELAPSLARRLDPLQASIFRDALLRLDFHAAEAVVASVDLTGS